MKLRAILWAMLSGLVWAQPTEPGAELVRAIRNVTLDPEQAYLVRGLSFARDDIKVYFNNGYLIFSAPVGGKRIAAVFMGDEDPADGEVLLLPPDADERRSLAQFTGRPNLDEHFETAVFSFTDDTAEELLREIRNAGRGRASEEVAQRLARIASPAVTRLTAGFTLRIAADLLSQPGTGFLLMALDSRRLDTFDVLYDPTGDDQILAGQLSDHNGSYAYDVWTSFRSRAERTETARELPSPVTITDYRIAAELDRTLHLRAKTHATFTTGSAPVRAMQFAVSRAERVTGVRLDGQPVEVMFQDTDRSRALRADENDLFLVISPVPLEPGSRHEIDFDHEGDVIVDRGSGVYAVSARANWYPRMTLEFAQYDLEFRYPRELTLVTPGETLETRTEGDTRIVHRRTQNPIRVAGFNLGQYEHTSKKSGEFVVDVYGNRGLDPMLAPRPVTTTIVTTQVRPLYRGAPPIIETRTVTRTAPPPDPIARLEAVADDVSQSLRFYAETFGAPALPQLTVSPIPGTSGQGFPGLIYLSTLSYLDETERPRIAQDSRQRVFYTDLMVAHEVAHQWWGNVVASKGYQDEWIMEALAHYSALMWLDKKRGTRSLNTELAESRRDLMQRSDDGGLIDSFGPLTWGYRLEAAKSRDTWRTVTYEKGAWIFHMLRMRLGDVRFMEMLKLLRQRYEYQDLSTAELEALVREVAATRQPASEPPPASADAIEAFFDSWVRATGIPDVHLEFTRSGRAPQVKVAGKVTYSGSDSRGVGRNFAVELPLRIEFAGGKREIRWVRSSDAGESFEWTLAEAPTRISVATDLTLATER